MAGIYIHIPFCKQACHYCNFHFSTSLKLQNDFIAALLKEISIRAEYLGGEQVSSIYFGGGTPSLLAEDEIATIMIALNDRFNISGNAEVTFEANPDDITPDRLGAWKHQGINRLSIGIQSFFEEDLIWMNRAHDAAQARECVPMAMGAGFENMSIDLIYGGPTLPDSRWIENLTTAAGLRVPHLSCYALTVEPGTALEALTRKEKVKEVNNEDQARQFLIMTDYLQSMGYEHYEISNLALPGKRSLHNSSYWNGAKYLGLGPSAHSFNGTARQWNVANNASYINSLRNDRIPFESEMLTGVQKMNEYIMTSLRTMEGTSLNHISEQFGQKASSDILHHAKRYADKGWLIFSNDTLTLTREGKLFADGIAADLFAERDQTSTDSMFLKPSRG